MSQGSGPTGRHTIIQVHPTRRCNLRCLHCYSSSGPEVKEELDEVVLARAIRAAKSLGYSALGVSGGEPLLYEPLGRVLDVAHEAGFVTTVTSNGMLLNDRAMAQIQDRADLLAISLDGVPESHNRLRVCDRAFDTMRSCLDRVRGAGIPFGFIFTLTYHNVHELDWVARFAIDQGAVLLQIHPLEIVGRANTTLAESEPDGVEGAYALWEALRLQQEYQGRLQIQLDMATAVALKENPGKVYAGPPPTPQAPFAEVLSPLVIETDGTASPLVYGFPRHYALGNICAEPLTSLAERWRIEKMPSFRAMCERVYRRLLKRKNISLVNWYEEIRRSCTTKKMRLEGRHTPNRSMIKA